MSIKKVTIIAIQEIYLDTITKQVKEILGDKVMVHSITVKDLQKKTVTDSDIVVISNSRVMGLVSQLIPRKCPIIVAKRDINYANTWKLLNLPPGQNILVVNDNKSNTIETVDSLRETIFENNYQAYSPEEPIWDTIDYIVTPGERHLLPKGLTNVIDIGSRLLDIGTFEEIVKLLKLDYSQSKISKRYFKACVSLSGSYDDEATSSKGMEGLAQYHFEDIITVSETMNETVQLAKRYSRETAARQIHIEGKPGTGKSMFAQSIHNYSDLADQSFVSINCLSKDINSILFGSDNGEKPTPGVFELAANGTICIEEIGELPLPIQEQIYQMLEEGMFLSLSSNTFLPLRSRVITTSSKDYQELVETGLFSRNLYNLLSTYSIRVPALTERIEDLLPLIDNLKDRIKQNDIKFTDEVIKFFEECSWESNVKELYNVITYLSLLEEDPIGIEFLPFYMRSIAEEQLSDNQDEYNKILQKIEEHGFLDESIEILKTFYTGKEMHISYGRKTLKKYLGLQGSIFSEQQLRMRMEVLQELGLIIVRKGRAGSTISRKGEEFLESYSNNKRHA